MKKLLAEFIGTLWLFWVAPMVVALLVGLVYKYISPEGKS